MTAHYSAPGAALFALLAELDAGSPLGAALPLAPARLALLRAVRSGGPATASELARRRTGSRQGVQRLADALVEDGLLARRPNPRHRRAPLFELTPGGHEALAACATTEARLANAWAEALDPSALRIATRLLQQVRTIAANDAPLIGAPATLPARALRGRARGAGGSR